LEDLCYHDNYRCVRLACQPTSQQYCSLILNQHQPPGTSQSAVLFSHNKSAPAISHSQAHTAYEVLLSKLPLQFFFQFPSLNHFPSGSSKYKTSSSTTTCSVDISTRSLITYGYKNTRTYHQNLF